MSNEIQKETAILEEQQSISKRIVVDKIIKILADNNLSIIEAREILNIASKKLGKQTVRVSS